MPTPAPWAKPSQSETEEGEWVFIAKGGKNAKPQGQQTTLPPPAAASPWQKRSQELASNNRELAQPPPPPAWWCEWCGTAHINPRARACRACGEKRFFANQTRELKQPPKPWVKLVEQPEVGSQQTQPHRERAKMPQNLKQPLANHEADTTATGEVAMTAAEQDPVAESEAKAEADLAELEATRARLLELGLAKAAHEVGEAIASTKAKQAASATPAKAKRLLDQAEKFEKKAAAYFKEKEDAFAALEQSMALAKAAKEEAEAELAEAREALQAAIRQHAELHAQPGVQVPDDAAGRAMRGQVRQELLAQFQTLVTGWRAQASQATPVYQEMCRAAEASGAPTPDVMIFMWERLRDQFLTQEPATATEEKKAAEVPVERAAGEDLPPTLPGVPGGDAASEAGEIDLISQSTPGEASLLAGRPGSGSGSNRSAPY